MLKFNSYKPELIGWVYVFILNIYVFVYVSWVREHHKQLLKISSKFGVNIAQTHMQYFILKIITFQIYLYTLPVHVYVFYIGYIIVFGVLKGVQYCAVLVIYMVEQNNSGFLQNLLINLVI